MSQSELEKLIARVGDLPAMPVVAVKVMSMIGDPSISANHLQAMISRDQALTVKVLKIANSAMFGVSRDITTLSHAIVILGFSTIRSIVLAASSKSIYARGPSTQMFSTKLLWEHSLASAVIARRSSEMLGAADIEKAFIAALLHDIGKSVLNVNFSDKYHQIIEEVYNTGSDFIPNEQRILGFDHTQVGSLVLHKWNLAPELEEAVLHHHTPYQAEHNPKLTAIVSFANALSNKLGIGPTKKPAVEMEETEAVKILGLADDKLAELVQHVSDLLEEDREIFEF
ncbi:MAG TPA: HDOD domain-containing protein [Acidobacteriota bacterium]|nr:HDOD domain-containing protein [Acidobacteriota bacterium]